MEATTGEIESPAASMSSSWAQATRASPGRRSCSAP